MLSLSILDVKFQLKLLNYIHIPYLGLTEEWKEVESWIEL